MVDKSSSKKFFHLRLHTEFSINDGLVTIPPLIERLKSLDMTSVSITDFSKFFALIKFYSAAVNAGI